MATLDIAKPMPYARGLTQGKVSSESLPSKLLTIYGHFAAAG